ncbi:uncharacterized protein LOC144452700 [Glandiceps talaboti]
MSYPPLFLAHRLRHTEVRVGDSEVISENPMCGQGAISGRRAMKESIDVICGCGLAMRGRWVGIQMFNKTKSLTLCEVEVFVEPREPGEYTTLLNEVTSPAITAGPTTEVCVLPDGLINIAHDVSVYQSSVKRKGVPERAIDGNKDSNFAGKSCTFTAREYEPWWKVDLGEERDIYKVTITNRMDCCSFRIRHTEVRVGNSEDIDGNALCGGPIKGKRALKENIDVICGCGQPLKGRWVGIKAYERTRSLVLCEVEIYSMDSVPGLATDDGSDVTQPTFTFNPTTEQTCTVPDGLVNVAKGKRAEQISILRGGKPQRAIDGNLNSDFKAKSCTHTKKEMNPWWRVDLGAEFEIYQVTITNRQDCCPFRIKTAQIRISNGKDEVGAQCGANNLKGRAAMRETIGVICKCGEPIRGRFVTIQIMKERNSVLSLCEVEVMATPQPDVVITTEPAEVCIVPDSVVNLAVGASPSQSSTKKNLGAKLAVDGNTDTNYNSGSCTLTKKTTDQWWQLDLGEAKQVYKVVIYNRKDCCDFRLNGAEVRVGDNKLVGSNPLCGVVSDDNFADDPIEILCGCSEALTGQYVSIQLAGVKQVLTICEVQVFGLP